MAKINPHIFRAYDIRGIAADTANGTVDLDESAAYHIGLAAGTYLRRVYNTKHMAVGRDVRQTSELLQTAYIKGILETGVEVTNIGLSPSPMIYFASCTEALEFDAATNITASHNPKEYNGIKIVANNAHSICGDELQEIRRLTETEDYDKPETKGSLHKQDIWPLYKKELLTKIDTNKLKNLKVVIDAGNGVAGPFITDLLSPITNVTPLFCEPDGTFPNHEANPEELSNMQDLIKEVQRQNANLGIGFDGDGDRIGVVDEKGTHYSSDYLLLLLTKDLLQRHKKPQIVFDVKVSQAIINKMEELGAIPVMSKTGHSFIEQKMKDLDAPLGGEVSGHMFFGENYYGFDDAFLAALKILEILANANRPYSTLFDDLPKTVLTPEYKLHCPDDEKFAIVAELAKTFTQKYDCITIDGVRIKFDALSWGAIRASNTSPNLTMRMEATDETKMDEIKNIMLAELKKHPEINLGNIA